MKILLAFIIIAATARTGVNGSMAPGIRVKYGYGEGIGTSFFYDIARNETQAKANGMIKATPPERLIGPLSQLSMYCMDSYYHFCALYDDTGYFGGVQVGFAKDEINDTVFNFDVQGFISWNVTMNGVETEFWVTHAYFITTENLATSAESRIATRNSTKILQYGGVWVTGFYGEQYFIPDVTSEMENNSFTKQGCFPGMGLHYYYNVTEDTPCTSDIVLSWFAVASLKDLVAFSIITPGTLKLRSEAANVFETSNSTFVKINVPYGPQCFYDLADKPGVVTLHVYLVDEPWTISCDFI